MTEDRRGPAGSKLITHARTPRQRRSPPAEEHIVVGQTASRPKGQGAVVPGPGDLCPVPVRRVEETNPSCDGSPLRDAAFDGDGDGRPRPLSRERGKDDPPRPGPRNSASPRASALAGRTPGTTPRSRTPRPRAAVEEALAHPPGQNDGAAIEPTGEPGISLIEDPRTGLSGALRVKGGIPIESADGFEYERLFIGNAPQRQSVTRFRLSYSKPSADSMEIPPSTQSAPDSPVRGSSIRLIPGSPVGSIAAPVGLSQATRLPDGQAQASSTAFSRAWASSDASV